MDSASEDIYLQKIEEFVYDEDKIVTFRWLSSTLGVSANDAKRLLEKYVADHRSSKPSELALTYLLSGMIEENNLAFAIVKEQELNDKRDALINVLSEQIYSVQKCKQTDLNAVSLADYFDMHTPSEAPIIGSVLSKNCIKRVFKPKKALPLPQQPTTKGKASFFAKPPPKSTEKVEPKAPESVKQKTPVKEVEATTKPKRHTKEAAIKPKQNGIASFFTKGASKAEPNPKASEKMEEEKELKVEPEEMDTNDRIKSLVDTDSESEDIISPTPTSQQSKENKKPKRSYKRQKKQNKNSSAPSPKRRRRIVEHNDSDSDDIFGNDEKEESMQEDVVENSEEDSEPVLKPTPQLAPKNKKRKFVSRTFQDEDGYFVTQKEWVEASGSEEDEPETVAPAEVVPAKSEVVPAKSEVVPAKSETKDKPKVKDDNKKLNNSQSESSGDKAVNGRNKGGKNKKAIAANQKTLMSFFTRK